MIDLAELRETATKTPTTTDRELVWAAADRIGELEAKLAAEREACAIVAEQYTESADPALRYMSPHETAEAIAADIRKRKARNA